MAGPTWSDAATQLTNGIKPFADLVADLPTIVTSIDTAEQDLEGDFLPAAVVGQLGRLRQRLSTAYGRDLQRAIWLAWLRESCRVANFPDRDVIPMAYRIFRYMHSNSYSFNDRNQTIATSGTAAGGNTGNGTCDVLSVDWQGYTLQTHPSETVTIECVQDQNTGVLKNAEVFEYRGQDASKDNLDETGSGTRARMYAMHAGGGTGGSVLQNASWAATFNGTGTDKISGWTIGGTASKITQDTSTTYNTPPGVTTPASLAFASDPAATNEVYQALSLRRINAAGRGNAAIPETVPWMFQVAYKHSTGSITGTMNLKMGSKTQAIDLAGATTSWQVALFDRDKDLYYHNWKEDAPDIEVEVVNLSAGTLYVANPIFAPMTMIGGLWWWLAGGSTAFLLRDEFTHATTGGTWANAELMNSLRQSLPEVWFAFPTDNTGAETIADP